MATYFYKKIDSLTTYVAYAYMCLLEQSIVEEVHSVSTQCSYSLKYNITS